MPVVFAWRCYPFSDCIVHTCVNAGQCIRINAAITLLELFQLQRSVDIVSNKGTVAFIINVKVTQCQMNII